MPLSAVSAGEGFTAGTEEMWLDVLVCSGKSDTFGVFARNLREFVDFRGHAQSVFSPDRPVLDDVQGASRRYGGEFL
jgi:hypothetical protein